MSARKGNARTMIPVAWKPMPLFSAEHISFRPEGMTILEMIQSIDQIPYYFYYHGVVLIDQQEVPRNLWSHVKPKRSTIVSFHLRFKFGGGEGGGGGGGGGKNTLAIVATIVTIAAVTAIGAGALGPVFGAALFGQGTLGATLAATGVAIAGGLAVSALTPPPSLTSGRTSSVGTTQADREEFGQASLQGNVVRPGGPIPKVVGTFGLFPPIGCNPLLERVGNDEYGEAIYVLAGAHELTNIRVGETSIDEIEDIQYEIRNGFSSDTLLTLIERQSRTEGVNIELSQHKRQAGSENNLLDQASPENSTPLFHHMVSRDSPDEIWIPITWPRGHFDQASPTSDRGTLYRIRIREKGDITWIHMPEIEMRSKKPEFAPKTFKFMFMSAPVVTPTPPTDEGPDRAFIVVPATTTTPTFPGWTADSHFDANTGGDHFLDAANVATSDVQNIHLYSDRVEFYLDLPKGIYEIEIRQSMMLDPDQLADNYDYKATATYDFFEYFDDAGVFEVPDDLGDRTYTAVIPRVSSVWNEHPVPKPGVFALIAVKVKNRSLDRLSVVASGYTFDWNEANQAWTDFITTSNPAPHFRDALVGTLRDDPLPLDLLDEQALLDWRDHNIDMSYEVNGVLEGTSVRDALQMITGCGYARPRWSEKWGVMQDRDRSEESPVQLFSFRNMRALSWEKAFAEIPDGFRVRFHNSEKNYEEDEIIVFDPLSVSGSESSLQDIKYDGLVTENEARTRAEFDLKQARLRSVFYTAESNVQGLICERGDLVAIQHDVIDHYGGSALISTVNRTGSPSTVMSIVLDGSVNTDFEWLRMTGWLGSSGDWLHTAKLGVAIRENDTDRVISTHQATGDVEGDATVLTFVTPISDPAEELVVPGQLITTGRLNREYKRCIFMAQNPMKHLEASLTFVDEAPDIWLDHEVLS